MKHIYKFEKKAQISTGTRKSKRAGLLFLVMLFPLFIMSACMEDDFEGELRDVCPQVESHTPQALDDRVPINSSIVVTFNKEMKPQSINQSTFIVRDASGPIAGNISYSDKAATFTPNELLPELTNITVEITTEVYDLYDFTIEQNAQWAFTTGMEEDISAPYVVETIPEDGEMGVFYDTPVIAIFNEPLDPESIGPESITLLNKDNGQTVAGTVFYANMVLTFTPENNLDLETNYEAIVSASVTDLFGNSMGSPKRWNFKTGETLLPINLTDISEYAILAGTHITNSSGPVSITGDVGLFPGVRSDINFSDDEVNGNVYATGPVPVPGLPQKLIRDKLILQIAYNNAESADNPPPQFLAGDQAGKTLSPGIYKAGLLRIINGDLTLDAGGDPNAFWIFQAESLLETKGNIVLVNGADPENVFWQVGIREFLGPNVLIGEDTHFVGTILSKQGISVKSGATVTGRLMVKDGGVRLNNATISLP